MRVLLITTMYPSKIRPYSGIFVKRQVEVLREIGVEVILVKAEDRYSKRNYFQYYGELLFQAIKHYRDSFDLVHVHFPVLAGIMGRIISQMKHNPLILTFHGGEIDAKSLKYRGFVEKLLIRSMVGFSISKANAIISVGKYLQQNLENLGGRSKKIYTIDMGVDTQKFFPQDKQKVRRYLGLPQETPCVACVANFSPQKGQEYLIRAADLLRKNSPPIHWYLIGGGPLENQCKELVKKLGIEGLVHFCGPRPPEEIPYWDSAVDVVAMPSTAEAFGLAALEALACGTPVIASKVGGLPDFIQDGINGYLVPPANPEAIAEKTIQLLRDQERYTMMRQKCIEIAREHDLRTQTIKVMSIYDSLIS